jgi:nicotinate-nucleotide adenylyltransferase
MHIGLYFGSFNPIHVGHLIIANHVLNYGNVDRVWFMVSPHNPLKESSSLLNEHHRYHLVQLAVEPEPRFRASNMEFSLPRPSYTIDTMTHLKERYPEHQFSIIMGSDSYQNISKWKNYQQLLEQYALLIYKRPNAPVDPSLGGRITILDAPMLDISSTYIRGLLKEKKSVRYLVTDEVMKDILANGYFLK